MQMRNMNGVVRLRGVADTTPTEPVELAPLIGRLATSRGSLAQAAGVTVDTSRAATPVTVQADAVLMELAVANVLDNAIIYSRQGGQVRVELHAYEHGSRFRLLIADNGPGVTDEEFEGLTANRRFRGDESRTRRPGTRGLGLALAREVADRFSLQLDLRRPTDGGIEAEFSPRA
jgi:signal transduction histidine kinase